MKLWSRIAAILCLVFLPTALAASVDYQIERMKDNVYRFSAGHYRSVFLVGEQGIFIADPLGKPAAQWLQRQLREQFDVPVRYMAYSHNHVDHTLGGDVFAESGVTVIAQRYAAEDLAWTRAPTATPDITFEKELRVNLGDDYVLLRYYGPNNGRGSVSMRFMPANVVHVVDWVVLGRMPYQNLPGYDIHGMIRSTRALLAEEPFELFVGGHAEAGKREDVERYLHYLERLYGAVRDGMLAGKDLPTLQKEIRLPEFRDLKMYEAWLPANIEGVYRTLMDQSYFNLREDIRPAP